MGSLIYLHGFASGPKGAKGSFCRHWAEERGLSFRAPDLNLPSFEALTLSAQVAEAERVVGSEGVPPVVVGSSLGGLIAAALAHRGAPLRRLVLLAPAFGFARRRLEVEDWRVYRERGEMEVFHHAAGRPMRLGPDLLRDLPRWMDEAAWGLPCPAVILHGRRDESVPLAESEVYAARNPRARLHILEDDHALLAPATLELLARELEIAFA